MQESCNNCFWSKKHNTTLHQVKISKHARCKVTAHIKGVIQHLFLPIFFWERVVIGFWPEVFAIIVLPVMVLICSAFLTIFLNSSLWCFIFFCKNLCMMQSICVWRAELGYIFAFSPSWYNCNEMNFYRIINLILQ